jgi:predicted Zn-dependent peptidase
MYEQYQLQNNATIILVPLEDTKALTTMVMYPVGSRYEAEKLRGVSHFIEHLMFKGTKKRKNTLALTREIDRLGAEYNAFTSKEYTGYYIKSDARYAKVSFDILSDMLFNSKFDAKEMEREKTVICEEIKMYNDNPLMNIDNIFEEVMFAGPLGADIAGTCDHVMRYKRSDVLDYFKKYYQPKRMTIVVAGAVDDKVRGLIEQYFGAQKNSGSISQSFTPGKFGSAKKKDRIVVQRKDTEQSQLMLGFPAFGYGDDRNATVSVMNTILGGSMSSRLFIRIRERMGLAYMVRSGADQFRDTGYVYVRAGLDTANINKAIAAITKEIEKLKEKGVTKGELKDAKTHIMGGLTLAMEDSSFLAGYYAKQQLFYDEIKTPEEKYAAIEAVTQDDILKVANQIYKMNQMRVAVIGNVSPDDVVF